MGIVANVHVHNNLRIRNLFSDNLVLLSKNMNYGAFTFFSLPMSLAKGVPV